MKTIERGALYLLLMLLPACGQQLVEFPSGDGGSDAPKVDAAKVDGLDAPVDGANPDLPRVDGPNADGLKVDGPNADGLNVDGLNADGSNVDGLNLDAGLDGVTGDVSERAPFVVSTDPAPGALGVVLNKKISATFSEPMNPATLNMTTFTLKQGTVSVAGTVSYLGNTATFSPTSNLAQATTYTATITTGARDSTGMPLANNYVWTFTTGTAIDTLAPTVLSTSPANLAVGVPIRKTLTATFSEPMDPTTINAVTFTLYRGLVPIFGTVSAMAGGTIGVFNPSSDLAPNTTYTATITTSAKDSAGNSLASNYTWTFTTSACGQAPVALGAASNFAVLAGSTVTNTGPTSVIGDMGVSPGTAVTGFPPGLRVGALHAGDPTSARAIADLTTAYNDAAGRTLCPITIAGNLGGLTLTPGLYKSTSSLEISAGDVTLDAQGDPEAVFIFQMASTFTTTAGRKVVLSGGATAANIFWQVGTSATFGSTSVMQGTVMADQAVTMNTGATLNGRLLARIAAVSLDANMVVRPLP